MKVIYVYNLYNFDDQRDVLTIELDKLKSWVKVTYVYNLYSEMF